MDAIPSDILDIVRRGAEAHYGRASPDLQALTQAEIRRLVASLSLLSPEDREEIYARLRRGYPVVPTVRGAEAMAGYWVRPRGARLLRNPFFAKWHPLFTSVLFSMTPTPQHITQALRRIERATARLAPHEVHGYDIRLTASLVRGDLRAVEGIIEELLTERG